MSIAQKRKGSGLRTGTKVGTRSILLLFHGRRWGDCYPICDKKKKHQRVSASSLSAYLFICRTLLRLCPCIRMAAAWKILLLSRCETVMEQEPVLKSTLSAVSEQFSVSRIRQQRNCRCRFRCLESFVPSCRRWQKKYDAYRKEFELQDSF